MACGRPKKSDGKPCTLPVMVGFASCLSHMTIEEDTAYKARRARAEAAFNDPALRAVTAERLNGDPACWSWPVPPVIDAEEDAAEMALIAWHDGRCAMCGGYHQVVDHDHETGLIRGLLCRACNTREWQSDDGKTRKYRERPPAVILGIRARYYDQIRNVHAEPADRRPGRQRQAAVEGLASRLPAPEDIGATP